MGMRKMVRCHDCGVEEGQLHKPGCDMEICPLCGGQLIGCDCKYEYYKQLPYRIPWVRVPNLCRLCGEVDPEFFKVSDAEWKRYVPPNLQNEVLCKACYERLKQLFPKGWRNVE
jgi:hypothetical protein